MATDSQPGGGAANVSCQQVDFGAFGIEATETIKTAHPETKVLALTALGDMSNISAMVKAGAEGYLLKGGRADELMNSLDAVARGNVAVGVSHSASIMLSADSADYTD
mgnify:CR=1 FL=1